MKFTSSSFVPESFCPCYCGRVKVPLVFRNKCPAARLSALRSFSPPFLRSAALHLYHLPSHNARAFRRLKPVWIAKKNLLLHWSGEPEAVSPVREASKTEDDSRKGTFNRGNPSEIFHFASIVQFYFI